MATHLVPIAWFLTRLQHTVSIDKRWQHNLLKGDLTRQFLKILYTMEHLKIIKSIIITLLMEMGAIIKLYSLPLQRSRVWRLKQSTVDRPLTGLSGSNGARRYRQLPRLLAPSTFLQDQWPSMAMNDLSGMFHLCCFYPSMFWCRHKTLLSPVATKLRKGDIGLPFVRPSVSPSVRPSALNNLKAFGRILMISDTGL